VRRIDSRPRPLPGSALPPLVPPATGDRCVVAGIITSGDGDPGTFHADVVRLHDQGQMPDGGVACTLEQHLFTLPQGTLVGSGTSDADGRGTFAVVGGTGAYATLRGTYTAEQQRSDLGGDGTARFAFDLSN
jgi:hypothetical protein